jgi:hypothetical protein
MPISVISEFVPSSSGNFPVVDVGNVRGAYWSVPTIDDRDKISVNNRKIGMLVHVQETDRDYRLVGGLSNSNWLVSTSNAYYATGIVNSSSWTIHHDLGYNPNVTIINSDGELVFGRINYLTSTSLQILFNQNVTGSGYCS